MINENTQPRKRLGIFYCSNLNICLLCFPELLYNPRWIHCDFPDFSIIHWSQSLPSKYLIINILNSSNFPFEGYRSTALHVKYADVLLPLISLFNCSHLNPDAIIIPDPHFSRRSCKNFNKRFALNSNSSGIVLSILYFFGYIGIF